MIDDGFKKYLTYYFLCIETELLTAYTKEKEEEKLKFESQLETRFQIY